MFWALPEVGGPGDLFSSSEPSCRGSFWLGPAVRYLTVTTEPEINTPLQRGRVDHCCLTRAVGGSHNSTS